MRSADVVVIGGGVMGVSIAHALAARGIGKTSLFEKSFLGAGSSGKSGAIIRQHYSNRITALMARKSLQVFQNFPDLVGGPPVFSHAGMVLVVQAKDRAAFEANVAMQRDLGIDVRIVGSQELASLDANVRLGEDELAAYEAEAGYVEAVQVVASYAQAARTLGAEICEGTEVTRILTEGQRIAGVETTRGICACRTVVLATGPWAARLAAGVDLSLPVQASRTQVALFRQPADLGPRVPIYGDFVQGLYFKPTHGQIIHAGSIMGEEIHAPADPDSYDESADGHWLPQVRSRLANRYPAMQRCYGRGGYAALYAITPDWHPIIDQVPSYSGLYLAVGFSGHGFKMSPVVGQLVAELISSGQASTLDIRPLRWSRFKEGDLVKTPYSYGVMG